jgi:hypothetical protein
MGICAFCQKEEKLTSEHIWGDWIKEFVPPTTNKHHFGQHTINKPGIPDEDIKRIRAGDPINAQAEILCGQCNHVELGGIQDRSKRYMVPLLRGEKTLLGLAAQKQIATWAAMATMTAEFLMHDPSQVTISQDVRRTFLAIKEPPEDWRIWIGHYQRWRFPPTYVHASLPLLSSEEFANLPDKDNAAPNMQSSSFILGSLYLHIISTTPANAVYVRNWGWTTAPRATRLLAQIWPPREEIVLFPFPMMNDIDARDFSMAFFEHLHNIARRAGF